MPEAQPAIEWARAKSILKAHWVTVHSGLSEKTLAKALVSLATVFCLIQLQNWALSVHGKGRRGIEGVDGRFVGV